MKRPSGFDQERPRPIAEESKRPSLIDRVRASGRTPSTSEPESGMSHSETNSAEPGSGVKAPRLTAPSDAIPGSARNTQNPPVIPEVGEWAEPERDAPVAPVVPMGTPMRDHFERDGDSGGAESLPVPVQPARSILRWGGPGDGVRQAKQALRLAERERRQRERGERKRFTAHQRVRRRRWFVGIGAVLLLALFVAIGVYTPIMAVRDIRVQGTATVSASEIEGALEKFQGVPLALVDDQEVHRALELFPVIKSYATERIPPHTLLIRVEERMPVLAYEREDGFDLRDPAGVLIDRVSERPVGVPLASAELQDTASPAFGAVASVIRDLPSSLRDRLVAAQATNAQDVTFTLDSGTQVLWGDVADTQRKAIVLEALIGAIGTPSFIDVSAPEAPVFT